MKEEWKFVKDTEYEISNFGNFRRNGKIIKGWVQNTGYRNITIKGKKYPLHRLVALLFIPNPNNYPVINHKDGNKLNNNVNNLEWCTQKHNIEEAIRLGLMKPKYASSENKIRAKKINQYTINGEYIKTFVGSVDAEKELKEKGIKLNARNIRNVCNGKRITCGGYKWSYVEE